MACATKVESPAGKVTVIAGLHHAQDDLAFTLPDCSAFTLDTTTAEDVFDDPSDANLEAYVKGVIKVSQELIKDITKAVFGTLEQDRPLLVLAATDPAAAGEHFNRKWPKGFTTKLLVLEAGISSMGIYTLS